MATLCPQDEAYLDTQTTVAGARTERWAMLQYLCQNNCPEDERTCAPAAEEGQVDYLKSCMEVDAQ